MKTLLSVAFMVSVLLLAVCGTPHRRPRTIETKILDLAPNQAESVLKDYKERSWVLEGIMTGSPVSPTSQLAAYMLKRQSK